MLEVYSKSLKDFPPMPTPVASPARLSGNRLLFEELSYDRALLATESDRLVRQLTEEQRGVYDTIMGDASSSNGGLFFVYGYGGTGKTFLWKTLSATLRSQGEIVINVASSGIASLLLPGGKTAHSRFAIPININEDSTCNIKPGTDLAELISKTKLIIWNEAPMMHKHCFEALDRTMRDLLRFSNPSSEMSTFGGKTVVLGGDFRQILPVIPKGSRQDIVSSTINSSYLWSSCIVLRLTKNLRLENMEDAVEKRQVAHFADWIASISDGTAGATNEDCPEVVIPDDMLLPTNVDPIATIVENTFPMFQNGSCDNSFLQSRAILAPTLDVVNAVNDYMSNLHEAESRTYLSCDSVCRTDIGS
ncbi:ATP-dependent DNA helicase PIF2-like [Ipomoea triloba]|uniref:ATP-dependent DNA helicase PIF2-like n=1 Tax=Ipomoea triloba TaxID=35885 RepID=UPI00125D8CFD|nr:ATP-dependent DNA helicase PIF2-like [Ipomoea triloba]